MLYHQGESDAGELIEQALRPPGPSRELLTALVLLSRRRWARASAEGGSIKAEVKKQMKELRRQVPVHGRPMAQRLCAAANRRTDDPKALDLYSASLEIESVERNPGLLGDIVGAVHGRWAAIKGDRRSLEDAKLGLLKQLGAALRATSDRVDTTPLYNQLFEMGRAEPSYSIRLAVAQEFGAGGNAAFAVIRERVGHLHRDPMQEYDETISELKAWRTSRFEVWAAAMRQARSTRASSPAASSELIEQLQRQRQELKQEYREQRVQLLREFVMRAWMLPMLLGSVDDSHRDEARERLIKWLGHLDPRRTGGNPDLPLALETRAGPGLQVRGQPAQTSPPHLCGQPRRSDPAGGDRAPAVPVLVRTAQPAPGAVSVGASGQRGPP
jgi:hypothetical protein